MRRFYWLPHRRPSYRAIETRARYYPWRVQRRWRWLWFDYWLTVGSLDVGAEMFGDRHQAESYIAKLERFDQVSHG